MQKGASNHPEHDHRVDKGRRSGAPVYLITIWEHFHGRSNWRRGRFVRFKCVKRTSRTVCGRAQQERRRDLAGRRGARAVEKMPPWVALLSGRYPPSQPEAKM